MNIGNPKDKELQNLVEQLAEKSDIQGITDLLVNWEEKSLLWILFVESRIVARSTTRKQREALKDAEEMALDEREVLLDEYKVWMNFLESRSSTEEQREALENAEENKALFEEYKVYIDNLNEILEVNFDGCYEEDEDEEYDDFDDEIPLTPEQQKMNEQLEQLMIDADNLQYEDVEKSIETYKKAIALMDKEPSIKDEYYYLYSHYIMSFLYPQLGEEYDEEIVAYSKKGLEYAESTYIYAPFTKIGKFYKEAIVNCCNAIVWHSLPTTHTQEGLEELLVYINKASKLATIDECPNLYGTKASLLLKLNRKEEGYRLVWTIKNNNADKHTYSHISKLKDYKKWEESQDLKTAESFILSEEDSKNETAEQAYQRLLEAEKLIATCGGYNYFDSETTVYREGWREKEATKTTGKKLEKWEKKHFKLDEGYKQFVIKHGYICFGTNVEDYYLEELNNDMHTLADAFLGEYGYSKEEIEERYDGDYSHLEDLLVIGWGDESLQIHYFILMDKEGGFYLFDQDDWDTIDERYTFDEFVSKVANLVIGNMINYW